MALETHPGGHELSDVPDDELLSRLGALVRDSRRLEADLVAHIGEVDERRLYARFAFPSMYAYCTGALHLTEAEAYRRITVARAARHHEMLLPMLRDGRLHISGLALLVGLLTPTNRDGILRRATHASRREIERLVAELKPKPDVRAVIRKLPDRPAGPVCSGPVVPRSGLDSQAGNPSPSGAGESGVLVEGQGADGACAAGLAASDFQLQVRPIEYGRCVGAQPEDGEAVAVLAGAKPPTIGATAPVLASLLPTVGAPISVADTQLFPGRVASRSSEGTDARGAAIQPLSPGRHKVQFTASDELREKLERLRALMRSVVPGGDLAAIIEQAVTEKLARLEARRFGKAEAPRKGLSQSDVRPTVRRIPAAVRRAVWVRDEGRCCFVDELGRRCSERLSLEFHHRLPYAVGGAHSPGNVCLLCRAHNQRLAERDFGKAAVQQRRAARTPGWVSRGQPTG